MKKFIKHLAVLGVLLLWLGAHHNAHAQNKIQLEKQKKEAQQKINETKSILSNTTNKKKASIGQLNAINNQIDNIRALIGTINKEIKLLDNEISQANIIIGALEADLDRLKQEYAAMVYNSYKARKNNSFLVFLFSSYNFNQLSRRMQYMRQYGTERRSQAQQIEIVKDNLVRQRTRALAFREEKVGLLEQRQGESSRLQNLQKQQNRVLAQLKQRETELRQELKDREASLKRLNSLIAEAVRREEEARRKNDVASVDLSVLSTDFAKNKRRLPWPVASGFISEKFGVHPHPTLRGVTTDNDGVDIQTKANENVKVVFQGRVVEVFAVPGMGTAVLVQHGDYYTLYARLKNVTVKRNETLTAQQTIGQVGQNNEGISELQFQVWKKSNKLNPASWLGKK